MNKSDFTFYVAGPWLDREDIVRPAIDKIRAAGWKVSSRWAAPDNPDVDPTDPERESKLRVQAVRDLEDVIKANGLIYINSRKSEGKATELGVSIAMMKPIIIVGSRENNIFLNLNIPAHESTEKVITWLEGEGKQYLDWVEVMQNQMVLGDTLQPLLGEVGADGN